MRKLGWFFSVLLLHSCYSAKDLDEFLYPDRGYEEPLKQWDDNVDDVFDDGPSQSQQDYQPQSFLVPEHRKVGVLIFNAFPNLNVSAIIVFEEERIDGLLYSKHGVQQIPVTTPDFLIEFIKGTTIG